MSKFVSIPHAQWLDLMGKIRRIEESMVVLGLTKTSRSAEFISKQAAKDLLGIRSDKTLYKLRDAGKVVATRAGKHYLYSFQSIQQFLKSNSSQ